MSRLVVASRFLVVLAVAGSILSAAALFVYGFLAAARVVWVAFARLDPGVADAEHLAVQLIQLVDLFLIGTVLYLVGMGLHLLFVDPGLRVPPALAVGNLHDLKSMVVRVIVVSVGVTFLGALIEDAEELPVLELAAAVAAVVAAYALVILVAKLPDRERAGEAEWDR